MLRSSLLLISLLVMQLRAETLIVVAKDSPIETLDAKYVADIFLARTTRFPNGDKALPLEMKGNAIRDLFYQQLSGKTSAQLNAYWTTLIFTGKGRPPATLDNPGELAGKLAREKGAISYLAAEQLTDDMKVVYRFP
jgi:hypothetical protein